MPITRLTHCGRQPTTAACMPLSIRYISISVSIYFDLFSVSTYCLKININTSQMSKCQHHLIISPSSLALVRSSGEGLAREACQHILFQEAGNIKLVFFCTRKQVQKNKKQKEAGSIKLGFGRVQKNPWSRTFCHFEKSGILTCAMTNPSKNFDK